ncbi:DNA repair protein XRCC3-like isoform X2 [Prorops nasuta]|uniref:DNA repair protein XRCC3-like isoform X2 n=1 Tax=Prorops nasuta TaxID=863751 RepID=UPI0034CF1974
MENCYEISAKSLKEQEKFLTTGCLKLDEKLKGGISCSGITQIYGVAGSGKTQLALQLSLTVQLPIAAGGFDADSTFPSRRLQELIKKLEISKKYGATGDKIFVQHISNMEQLEYCVFKEIPLLMNIHKIGLVIIDSIAGLYRVEKWDDESVGRSKSLRCVGQQLHKLCKTTKICVICINQVTAIINDFSIKGEKEIFEQPSLGVTWLSMITNSIHLYKKESKRYASVTSPYLPQITFSFKVSECGVTSIE